MPKSTQNFNSSLYGWLEAAGFTDIQTLDFNGLSVPDPADADQFRFKYRSGNYDYGTVGITVDNGTITVWYNEAAVTGGSNGIDSNWTEFITKLKDWSLRNGINHFDKENLDKLGVYMKKKKNKTREESLLEGWWGNKHTSYSDGAPTVKLIIKHTKALGDGDQRYHHIDKIFLENTHGERILVPSKKPSVGRAFARHLAEGGQYNDERWRHIKEMADDITNLGGFLRATRAGTYNESATPVVEGAVMKYSSLRETMRRLSGSRGYNAYFEDWQPNLMEGGDCDLGGLFTSSHIDPRIARAIPTLNKFNIGFTPVQEAEEFSRWADSITEEVRPEDTKRIEKLSSLLNSRNPLPVGADALSIKGQLDDLIADQDDRLDLFDELEELASADPDNDARSTIISWLQKNSTSSYYGRVLDRIEQASEQPQQPNIQPKIEKRGVEELMPKQFEESAELELAAIRKLVGLKK